MWWNFRISQNRIWPTIWDRESTILQVQAKHAINKEGKNAIN